MRLWLSKNSEVPARDQIVEQIALGIVSHDLTAGERLPSIRELSRRLGVHSNTVNAAYHELAERGWVEFRKGSGVYVRARDIPPDPPSDLDRLIADFLRTARERGHSLSEIQTRLKSVLDRQPPDRIVLVDPDAGLRAILVAEAERIARFPVVGCALNDITHAGIGAVVVALANRTEDILARVPPRTECLWLRMRSIPGTLTGQHRPAPDDLVAVVSHWPEFLRLGRTLLVAAGIAPEALVCVTTDEPEWEARVRACALIVTESLTARRVPDHPNIRVFHVISDESLADLEALGRAMA